MTDERKRWIDKNGMEHIEPDPRWSDPDAKDSYGVIPPQPRDTDVIYKLEYDADLRYLKLNSFVIQTFQLQSNPAIYFEKLFKLDDEVKTVKVHTPAKADVMVRNIKMPLPLRNAFFDTGGDGTILETHTLITRGRAKKYRVNSDEVDAYITKCRDTHYKLRDANKRK